ncbi:cytochrome C, partial [Sulfurimonas sp.]|nr:cytochrome C [Sulfurimonas sp.]
TTIDATMKLMQQGMDQINTGFMLNSKEDILQGISTLENSNAIFNTVEVAGFIKSQKVAVANNINKNLAKDLKALKKAIANSEYSEGTKQYAKVLNECVACHTIIRGW